MNYKHKVVLLLVALSVNLGAFSQSLNLRLSNVTMRKAMTELKSQTGYSFVYEGADLNTKKRVTVNAQSVDEAVKQILQGQNVTYEIQGKSIIVRYQVPASAAPRKEGAQQQKTTIRATGKVVDEKGEPIIGATVKARETNNGTITDLNGRYSLDVPEGSTLEISYIGYRKGLIRAGVNKNTNLDEDSKVLNEVVVVGYGTIAKRALTNSVSVVTPKDFTAGTASPLMAIQGKIAGLSVVSPNGADPNSDPSLQLRGLNSINGDQGPLVVIDGVPGADLNLVAKEDIESISVLKDASAASIYGTRASGGVILITTKKARAGAVAVNFSSELQMQTLGKTPDVLSAKEFRDEGRTDVYGQTVYDYGASTNWLKAVTNSAPFSQRYAVSASGGSEVFGVSASAYSRNANAIAIDNNRHETGGRVNSYFKLLDDHLEISTTLNYTDINLESVNNGIFQQAESLNPTYPIYDKTSESGYYMILHQPYANNPVAEVRLQSNNYRTQLMLTNLAMKLKMTKDLSLNGTLAYKHDQARSSNFVSKLHRASLEGNYNGSASLSTSQSMDKTMELYASYNHEFGSHSIGAVGGYSFQEFNSDGFSASNQDFLVDGLAEWNLGAGTYLTDGKAGMSSSKSVKTRLIAFFGRANWSYKDRYLADVSIRHEGSSKFYNGNRWGNFPGLSAGWRISSESFMEKYKTFLDDLKLRASYGMTGNQGFDATVAYRTYSPTGWTYYDGQWIQAYGLSQNQNKNLKWETKKEFDLGLDFSFLNHRISGRLDYYDRKIENAIYSGIQVSSPPAVFSTSTVNIGTITNNGFEFELSGIPVQTSKFSWNTSVVGTILGESKLEQMATDTHIELGGVAYGGGNAVRIFGGQDIGKFFVFRFAGVKQDDGTPMIYSSKDKIIPYSSGTDADRVQTGHALPRLQLSWNNTLRYDNWDLTVFLRSWIGNDVYNVPDMLLGVNCPLTQGQNLLRSAYTRNVAITNTDQYMLLDYWIENGSFLKLDNVTLGYTLSKRVFKYINNLRFYLSAHNIFTITGYTGVDPEVNINGLAPGMDNLGAYPEARTFVVGIQFSL